VGGDVFSALGLKCGFMEGIEHADLIVEQKSFPTNS